MAEFLDFAEQGERLVSRGKTAYDDDEMLRLAAEALLHKIGGAVARVERYEPALISGHPEVSWRTMKAIRNLVAHDYGAVDDEIVWAALARDLPCEAELVRGIFDARRGGL